MAFETIDSSSIAPRLRTVQYGNPCRRIVMIYVLLGTRFAWYGFWLVHCPGLIGGLSWAVAARFAGRKADLDYSLLCD